MISNKILFIATCIILAAAALWVAWLMDRMENKERNR